MCLGDKYLLYMYVPHHLIYHLSKLSVKCIPEVGFGYILSSTDCADLERTMTQGLVYTKSESAKGGSRNILSMTLKE